MFWITMFSRKMKLKDVKNQIVCPLAEWVGDDEDPKTFSETYEFVAKKVNAVRTYHAFHV